MDDDVRAVIAERYAKELAACDQLAEFAAGIRSPWGGRSLDPDQKHELLLAIIFARTSNTYNAAVQLARSGFGQQAAMLNRSLFEDMIDAHWVTVEPDQAVQRLDEHHLHGRMLLADAVRIEGLMPEEEIPTFDPARRSELDGVFGRYGEKSWTGLSLHARTQVVRPLWGEEPGGREAFDHFRRIVHRENNQILHLSAFSIGSQVRARDEDAITLPLGPSDEHVGKALLSAFWTFGQTVSVILDTFEFDLGERWKAVYADAAVAFESSGQQPDPTEA